ncbi:MAG: hypothetical protein K5778_07460, partial [Bacteroidaceae bacterium]|nr:hypothetical protein [Bacteroidaceae bacterium]
MSEKPNFGAASAKKIVFICRVVTKLSRQIDLGIYVVLLYQSILTVLVQLFHCGGTKISLRRYKSSTAVKQKYLCGGTKTPLRP